MKALIRWSLFAVLVVSCGAERKDSEAPDQPQQPPHEESHADSKPSNPARTEAPIVLQPSRNQPIESPAPIPSPVPLSKPENYDPSSGFRVVAEVSLLDGCQSTLDRRLGEPVMHLNGSPVPNTVQFKIDAATKGKLEIASLVGAEVVRQDFVAADPSTIAKIVDQMKSGKMVEMTPDQACTSNGAMLIRSLDVLPSPAFPAYGQESLLLATQPGGKDQLSVAINYRGEKMLAIKYTGSLSDSDLGRIPEQIKYNVFNRHTQTFVGDWQAVPKAILLDGVIVIHDDVRLFRVLPFMTSMQLVFDVERTDGKASSIRRVIFDLGKYCAERPLDYFTNLTEPNKKCSEIQSSDIQKGMNGISFGLK